MKHSVQKRSDFARDLRKKFSQDLPKRLAMMHQSWGRIKAEAWSNNRGEKLAVFVRGLGGAAKALGEQALSRASDVLVAELSSALGKEGGPDSRQRAKLDQYFLTLEEAMRDVAAANIEVVAAIPKSEPSQKLYIYAKGENEAGPLCTDLSDHQIRYKLFTQVEHVRQAVLSAQPKAIVAVLHMDGGAEKKLDLLAGLAKMRRRKIPLVMISTSPNEGERLRALRAGVDAYFSHKDSVLTIQEKIDALSADRKEDPFRALVMEKDTAMAERQSAMLAGAGMQVRVCEQEKALLTAMTEVRPDVLVMNLHEPMTDGLELARSLRHEEAFIHVPIVLVSSSANIPTHTLSAYDLDADKVMLKPMNDARFLDTVMSRAKQGRKLGDRISFVQKFDEVTGFHRRERLNLALDEVRQEAGEKGAVALFFMTCKFPKTPGMGDDDFNLALSQVSDLLRKFLQPEDLAARYDKYTLAVMLRRDSAEKVQAFVETVREGFATAEVLLHGTALAKEMTERLEWVRGGPAVLSGQEQSSSSSGSELSLEAWRDTIEEAMEAQRFYVVFQPILTLAGDGVERYELFLRLRLPNNRTLTPGEFMASGVWPEYAVRFDQWVVLHALQLGRENVEGSPIFFINLSPQSLADFAFVGWLGETLKQHDFPADRLVFEVAEEEEGNGALLPLLAGFSSRVHRLGVKVALDHFGKSAQSMRMMQFSRPDFVKIHGALVRDIEQSEAKQAQLTEICNQAARLGVKTVVTYVEDAKALPVLWDMGLNMIQGNYIQEPHSQLAFDFSSTFGSSTASS